MKMKPVLYVLTLGVQMKMKLQNKADAYAFYVGAPACWINTGKGWRRERWYDRLPRRVRNILRRLSRKPRCVVVDVDTKTGSITCERLVWSWRRWKWEAR